MKNLILKHIEKRIAYDVKDLKYTKKADIDAFSFGYYRSVLKGILDGDCIDITEWILTEYTMFTKNWIEKKVKTFLQWEDLTFYFQLYNSMDDFEWSVFAGEENITESFYIDRAEVLKHVNNLT